MEMREKMKGYLKKILPFILLPLAVYFGSVCAFFALVVCEGGYSGIQSYAYSAVLLIISLLLFFAAGRGAARGVSSLKEKANPLLVALLYVMLFIFARGIFMSMICMCASPIDAVFEPIYVFRTISYATCGEGNINVHDIASALIYVLSLLSLIFGWWLTAENARKKALEEQSMTDNSAP